MEFETINQNLRSKYSVYDLIILVSIISFVVFKIPYLSLPFYWDEAWVYGPAIRIMEESGPCLLPGCISDWWYTGHPLLFYFLASSWMKFFGATCFSGHVFALTTSIMTLSSLYYVGGKMFDKRVGLLTTLLLMTTPVFASQSGILVPEVLLTLFSVWAIYFGYIQKFWWYFIFAVLVLYVKESGAVLICAVSMHGFLFNPQKGNFIKRLLHSLALFSPILVGSLFYITQFYISNYFFYPRHLNWVDFSYQSIRAKFEMAYIFVTQDQGRIFISKISITAMILYLLRFRLKKLNKEVKSKLGLLLIFILGFMSFCSLNYLSQRYMLSMLPFFFLVVSYFIINGLGFKKLFSIFIIFATFGINVYSLWKDKTNAHPHDISLAYRDMTEVHQEVVNYLIENNYQSKKIVTHGLVHTALVQPLAGYLSKEESEKFISVNVYEPEEGEIIITSIIERDDVRIQNFDFDNLELIKNFKKGNSWCKIWRNKIK